MRAWMFPGQGAQYVGMAHDLLSDNVLETSLIKETRERLGTDIVELMLHGPEEVLRLTENAQPAIVLHSVLAAKKALSYGYKPDYLVGQSLGEYSALVVAGSMDLLDALEAVKLRGNLMQNAVPDGVGSMAAIVGLRAETVKEICDTYGSDEEISISNYNAPEQVVISGLREIVDSCAARAKEAGARRVVNLDVSAPFHTKLLAGAAEGLRKKLESVRISTPSVPVISNVTGEPAPQDKAGIVSSLVEQVCAPVRWEQGVKYLLEQGVHAFFEIGPGSSLSGLVKKISRGARVYPTDGRNIEEVMKEGYADA